MEAVVDQAGRIVLPKYIRDALGLLPGTKVDISPYGAGVQVVPAGRTARLVEEDGVLVSAGDKCQALVKGAFDRNIYIRDRSTEPGCAGCIRVGTGLIEHTKRAIAVLEEVLCAAG